MAAQARTFLHEDPFPSISHSSSWSTIASSNSHQQNSSKNPFRRTLGAGLNETPSLRKNTPTRAVFDDLLTAHSSITSGKISTRVTEGTEGVQEEYSLHLQELEVAKRPTGFISSLPSSSLPLTVSESIHKIADNQIHKGNDHLSHMQPWQNLQPVASEPPTFMFTSIKNAFAALSSPLTKEDACDRLAASPWPRDSLDLDDNGKRRSLRRVGSNSDQKQIIRLAQLDGPLGNFKRPNDQIQAASVSSVYRPGISDALCDSNHWGSQALPRTVYMTPAKDCNNPETKIHPVDLTSSIVHPKPTVLRHFSTTRVVSDGGSPPEGSTVGNIYNHYIRSDEIREASTGDLAAKFIQVDLISAPPDAAYDRPRTSKLYPNASSKVQLSSPALVAGARGIDSKARRRNYEQQRKLSLHRFAESEAQRQVSSLTTTLTDSSPYGETQDLPQLKRPASRTNSRALISSNMVKYGLSSSGVVFNGEEALPNTSNKYDLRNSFRMYSLSRHLIPPGTDSTPHTTRLKAGVLVSNRLPLEREVSEALRRESGFSAHSDESVSSSALEHYANFSIASPSKKIGVFKTKKISLSDSETTGDETRAFAEQAKAFYDQGAIALDWLTTHRQNVVRVPINRSRAMSHTPPRSPTPNASIICGRRQPTPEDDYNDWETVGESGHGLDNRSVNDVGLVGGTINRAGSSLANTSDEGTLSPYIPEIHDFGSTERIAQHPGHIRYFGDYRQRDLKKTHIPIFLPVFREHKVNGYLADSTRIRPPPPPFNIAPPQLPITHTNPFRSSPPKVIAPKRLSKRGSHPNHFKSFPTLSTDQESGRGGAESLTEHFHPRRNWMENFGEPGPAISNRNHLLRSASAKRPSSWRYVMGLASQRDMSGDGINSSFTVDSSSKPGVGHVQFHSKVNTYGTELIDKPVQTTSVVGRDLTTNSHRRAPLVRGPPGAFYKGLQAKTGESKRRSRSEPGGGILNASNGRPSVSDYPTNALRPLSLLRDYRPCTPIISTERRPSEDVLENDFVYRSPLAPPKRDSWKQLYSNQQMQEILDAAKLDGVAETLPHLSAGFSQIPSTKEITSRKHLFETPTLRLWRRDESTRTDLTYKKTKFSIIVLFFCTLFPPMLILYAWGRLDGIIQWLTDGTYSSFAKKQKKWALLLMCCWGVAIFLGLVAFLVYWFLGLHSR